MLAALMAAGVATPVFAADDDKNVTVDDNDQTLSGDRKPATTETNPDTRYNGESKEEQTKPYDYDSILKQNVRTAHDAWDAAYEAENGVTDKDGNVLKDGAKQKTEKAKQALDDANEVLKNAEKNAKKYIDAGFNTVESVEASENLENTVLGGETEKATLMSKEKDADGNYVSVIYAYEVAYKDVHGDANATDKATHDGKQKVYDDAVAAEELAKTALSNAVDSYNSALNTYLQLENSKKTFKLLVDVKNYERKVADDEKLVKLRTEERDES
jgi:hypothetical protein